MVIVSKRHAPEDVVISFEGLSMTGILLSYLWQNNLIHHNGSVNIPFMLQQEFEDWKGLHMGRCPRDSLVDCGTFVQEVFNNWDIVDEDCMQQAFCHIL